MSRLEFTQDPARLRLLIRSRPRRDDCIALRVHDEGVDVMLYDHPRAVLPWDAYNDMASDGWCVADYSRDSSYGTAAISVRVTGEYDAECGRLVAERPALWPRLDEVLDVGPETGHVLPIVRFGTVFGWRAESDTLTALMDVLHARAELRPALLNPERVWQLTNDISRGMLADPHEHSGVLRETVDIIATMRVLGYVHPFRRPIAAEPLPSLEQVVERVHARLDANPWRKGLRVDDADITRLVLSEYYEVKPWPFGALLPDQ